jgi:Flp pilus assembly protein CpaB
MTYRLRNIGLAIALAAVAVLLVFYYVAQERGRLQEGQELVAVWVATQEIPEGTAGSDLESGGFIQKSEVERDLVAPGALLDPQDVATKIVSAPMYEGEQVSALRFRSQAEQGVRAQLTGNLRAVQLPGDEHQLLAGTLQAGDRVDIVGTWNAPEKDTNHVSRVILRDILVLEGVQGTDVTQKVTDAGSGGPSVKLALTDAQEQKLFWIAKNGEFTLILRPPTDAADSPESAESWQTMLLDGLRGTSLAEIWEEE